LKTLFIDKKINYTGTQLSPHWIYRNFDLLGDAIVAFVGEADVLIDNMVDLADIRNKDFIYSPLMLHFIAEHFNNNLDLAIYRQRLLIVCIKEELEQFAIPVRRLGDDLYVNDGKLSVSIATSSTISTLIHTGLNIENQGTPVKTSSLSAMGIKDIKAFAEKVMLRYTRELEQIYEARCKVRGI